MLSRFRGVVWAVTLVVCSASAVLGAGRPTWVYVAAFQGGRVQVFDLNGGKPVHSIPVEDDAGMAGVATARDGKAVFVVDGDKNHRLRILDARTGQQTSQHPFTNRLLLPGNAQTIHLSADDRWLFIKTYDYTTAAAGVRVFDVARNAFLETGLRDRPCEAPLIGSAPGAVFLACAGWIQEMESTALTVGRKVSMPIIDAVGLTVSPNGEDVYVLEANHPDAEWRLTHWSRSQAVVQQRSLRTLPGAGPDGRQAWIAAVGNTIGIVHGARTWILDRSGLAVRHVVALPGPSQGASSSAAGSELITFAGGLGRVTQISVTNGTMQMTALAGLTPSAQPWILRVAPAAE
jgi:DNA-binding beta-propeller fold protein YncE